MKLIIDIPDEVYNNEKMSLYFGCYSRVLHSTLYNGIPLDKIRAEIEQLPTKTRTNWDGCCPDIDYPEIEYIDVTKKRLLSIIDKYKAESEDKE